MAFTSRGGRSQGRDVAASPVQLKLCFKVDKGLNGSVINLEFVQINYIQPTFERYSPHLIFTHIVFLWNETFIMYHVSKAFRSLMSE